MKFEVVSLDLEEDCNAKLNELKEVHKCHYTSFSDIDEFEDYASKLEGPVLLAISIKKNKQKKYKISSRLAKRPLTHVVFIAKSATADERVTWLKYGLDAYVLEPFCAEEILYHGKRFFEVDTRYNLLDENFIIKLNEREILYQGKPLKLTNKSFEMIAFFVQNRGRVISREELMDEVFSTSEYLSDRTVDTHIKKIRKLTDYDLFITVHKLGYVYNYLPD